MSKPFGYSYLVDLYYCKEGAADDLELHYRFLEKLVAKLGMTAMAPPVVIHANSKFDKDLNRTEVFPEKAGVSGWQPLIESGIQIHSLEPKRFITIDCYSCNEFDYNMVRKFAVETFGAQHWEDHYIVRGINYGE